MYSVSSRKSDGMKETDIKTAVQSVDQTNGSAFYSTSQGAHDPANKTFYEIATTQVWPVMLIQTPGQRPNSTRKSTGFSSANMKCLKAKSVTTGSSAIPDSVPGVGSRMAAGTWGLAGVMMVALALL